MINSQDKILQKTARIIYFHIMFMSASSIKRDSTLLLREAYPKMIIARTKCQAANYPSCLLQPSRKLNSTVSPYCLSQRAVFYGTFLSALLTRSISSPIVLSYRLTSIKKEKEQPLQQFVLPLNQACQSGLCRVMP